LEDLENMFVWEREIYINILLEHIEEQKNKNLQNNYIRVEQ